MTSTNPTTESVTTPRAPLAEEVEARRRREEEELKERELREARERRQASDQAAADARRKEEEREKALKVERIQLHRELDEVHAAVMKVFPGFEKLAPRIEAATARYTKVAGELGDRFPDQQYIRHPASKLSPWLKLFVPVRSDR
jgi:hypothetical protein